MNELSSQAGTWFARNVLIPFTRAVLDEVEGEFAAEINKLFKLPYGILGRIFQ